MRLMGSERHQVEADSDLLTYICTSCDEFLVLTEKIRPSQFDLLRSANGLSAGVSTKRIVVIQSPPSEADNSHITPIICEKCGGRAHLSDCGPSFFAPAHRET
jgi:hypothetical protein